jgi:hypothetical protein
VITATKNTGLTQGEFVDFGTRLKALFQSRKIDYGVIGGETSVVKPLPWHSTIEWHLTTFETEADSSTRAGLLTLVTAARRFSVTGAFAAAEALATVLGPWTRREFMKSHKKIKLKW